MFYIHLSVTEPAQSRCPLCRNDCTNALSHQ